MEDPVSHLHPVDDPLDADAAEQTSSGAGERLRSTITFPYNGLADAELIADTLHQSWGGSATQDQIAGSLQTTPSSGTFRNKIGAARIFGAVATSRGNVKLTSLGHRLVDPKAKPDARVEAFMTVPLYKAVFEQFEGRPLPPDEGLERKLAELGVSPKQTAKARQAMNSSAKLAGFFDTDKTRLIRPPRQADSNGSDGGNRNREESKIVQQPIVVDPSIPLAELWLRLLNEGADWSAEKTQDFVKKAREMREVLARDN